MKATTFALSLLVFSLQANAFDAICSVHTHSDKDLSKLKIANISSVLTDNPYHEGAYLPGRDAMQRDSAWLDGEFWHFDMHNGCDNFYSFKVEQVQLEKFLNGHSDFFSAQLEYGHPDMGPEQYQSDELAQAVIVCKKQ